MMLTLVRPAIPLYAGKTDMMHQVLPSRFGVSLS
jgi:hypothetical protein